MQFSQHIAVKTKYTFFMERGYSWNIHINRNNITLTDQNGNVLDIRHVNCKTIYWIFVYQKLKQPSCILTNGQYTIQNLKM